SRTGVLSTVIDLTKEVKSNVVTNDILNKALNEHGQNLLKDIMENKNQLEKNKIEKMEVNDLSWDELIKIKDERDAIADRYNKLASDKSKVEELIRVANEEL